MHKLNNVVMHGDILMSFLRMGTFCYVVLLIEDFFHHNLPIIRHGFAEQLIQYNLIRKINDDIESVGIMDVVLTQSFCAFKSNIKHRIISTYSEKCAFHSVTLAELLAKIHKYCLPIGMTYCVHSKKKPLSAYIVLACIYVCILEVYLRIFTLVLLVNILNLD